MQTENVQTDAAAEDRANLADFGTLATLDRYPSNIESMIGMRTFRSVWRDEYLGPLATTKAALAVKSRRGAGRVSIRLPWLVTRAVLA